MVWFNGALVDAGQARLSALDRGVIWGAGLFETLRVYRGHLWAFDEHYTRLQAGAAVLDLAIPAPGAVRDAMLAVTEAEGLVDAGTRLTVTGGAGPPDPHADATEPPNALVTAWPLRDYSRFYEHGADVIVLRGGGRSLPQVKTISYAASLAGRVAARRAGADDAVFVTADDEVLETTGSNLFAVFGDDLVTAPVAEGVLPGVTRQAVCQVAPSLGLAVREEPLWLDDVYSADEVLLTSSLREVYPVATLEGRELARSGHAGRLRQAFREHVRERLGLSDL